LNRHTDGTRIGREASSAGAISPRFSALSVRGDLAEQPSERAELPGGIRRAALRAGLAGAAPEEEASRPIRGAHFPASPKHQISEKHRRSLLLLPAADGCHPHLLRAKPAPWSPDRDEVTLAWEGQSTNSPLYQLALAERAPDFEAGLNAVGPSALGATRSTIR